MPPAPLSASGAVDAQTTPNPLRRAPLAVRRFGVVAVVGVLAGCSAQSEAPRSPGPTPPPASPVAAPAFPVTIDNCGFEVTLAGPPQRVVTIKSSATEMLLALGVADRIVGVGFPDGPVPPEYADDAAALPVLAERVPSAEVVLEVRPDLVYAGWESNLTGEGAGDRATLADLGVASYVAPAACKDPAYQPDRLTIDHVFAEITEVAALLDVPDAATDLIAAQQAALAEVEPDGRGLTALWYSSGTDVPYVGAGIGAPQLVMDAIGVTNIAAGIADTWTSFSWEQVVADDPDLIILMDAAWNSAEQKRELLASNPVTANLTAVRNERYLVVPFAASEAGVRTVPAIVDLAAQLAALRVG